MQNRTFHICVGCVIPLNLASFKHLACVLWTDCRNLQGRRVAAIQILAVIVRRHTDYEQKLEMKRIKLTTLVLGLLLFGWNQADTKTTSAAETKASNSADDKEQIQNLIRQAFSWAGSKNSIDLLPAITDSKGRVYIGLDIDKHKRNLGKLKAANFFSTEFIDNYNKIILTLDKGLRNGKYEQWLVGDLPPFTFVNNANPWCLCQDVPYDKPNPWDFIEINIINLDNNKGEADWKWGKLKSNTDQGWEKFAYRFRVVKENSKWKIAYLQGFDLKKTTRKDGQL